jgi:hypothetical protein
MVRLLWPKSKPVANIIAVPVQINNEQHWTLPELPMASPIHLAENGSGIDLLFSLAGVFFPGKEQRQTYREWIYSRAFI